MIYVEIQVEKIYLLYVVGAVMVQSTRKHASFPFEFT